MKLSMTRNLILKHLNFRYRPFLHKLHPRLVTYAMQNVGFTQDKEAGDDPEIQEILKACCVQDNWEGILWVLFTVLSTSVKKVYLYIHTSDVKILNTTTSYCCIGCLWNQVMLLKLVLLLDQYGSSFIY